MQTSHVGGTSPFPPLPSFPLPLEVGPLLRLGGLGSTLAPPMGQGRPGRQTVFGEFQAEISPLVATIFRSFSGNSHSI